ncbi:MAG: cysteine peptidase family C39 domain-containing protein [Geobacteraceae bacterium]|nr:cysteine peptidase family C39 domain-containing protein [Geobacteraceae bacterium]
MSSSKIHTVILLAIFLASGCTPFQRHDLSPGQAGLHVVPGVPFHAQHGRDDCGSVALASLLGQRGKGVALEAVTRGVTTPELGGAMLPDLENFARHQGFVTRSGRGDLALLRGQINAGRPVLIPVEMGFWLATRPHYLVVFGYDEEGFYAHTGTEAGAFIAAADLLSRWEKLNSLYLYLE